MAISETTLKDTILMLVEEQNKAGGLLGKQPKLLLLTWLDHRFSLKKPASCWKCTKLT